MGSVLHWQKTLGFEPLLSALLGSLVSAASGIVGAAITGWFSTQIEEVKLQAGVGIEEIKGGTSLNLEKLKFETG
jgi:hypothetical protein